MIMYNCKVCPAVYSEEDIHALEEDMDGARVGCAVSLRGSPGETNGRCRVLGGGRGDGLRRVGALTMRFRVP